MVAPNKLVIQHHVRQYSYRGTLGPTQCTLQGVGRPPPPIKSPRIITKSVFAVKFKQFGNSKPNSFKLSMLELSG